MDEPNTAGGSINSSKLDSVNVQQTKSSEKEVVNGFVVEFVLDSQN